MPKQASLRCFELLLIVLILAAPAISSHDEDALVTFVVASSGRWTLEWTLKSIINQTDPSWKVIVAFDGAVKKGSPEFMSDAPAYLTLPKIIMEDDRIKFLMLPLIAINDFIGSLRNKALAHVVSPWVAFVDDDDSIASDYISTLRQEISRPSVDGVALADVGAVVFRAKHQLSGDILPPLASTHLEFGKRLLFTLRVTTYVGSCILGNTTVSFALRTSLDLRFNNGCKEQFEILREAVASKPVLLSSHITYFIKGQSNSSMKLDARVPDRIPPTSSSLEKGTEAILHGIEPADFTCNTHEIEELQVLHTPYTISERIKYEDGSRANVNFVFPNGDTNSIFFHDNVHGLKVSLQNALLAGCLNSWSHGNLDVDVVSCILRISHFLSECMALPAAL
jgi:hypothetical protein